jgi:hypothetical protein
MDNSSRTVLVIGAAMVAGGLMEGAAFGQAAAPPAPAALYPTPAAPTCIVKAPTDCKLADGHPDLTGLYVAGGPGLQNGLASGAQGITFVNTGLNSEIGFEATAGSSARRATTARPDRVRLPPRSRRNTSPSSGMRSSRRNTTATLKTQPSVACRTACRASVPRARSSPSRTSRS